MRRLVLRAAAATGVTVGLALVVPSAVLAATTLYVTPTGSSSAACTQAAPCSFDHGVSVAASGDTVSVAAGSYTSAGNLLPASGVSINGPTGGPATVNFSGSPSIGIQLGNVAGTPPIFQGTNEISNLSFKCASCEVLISAQGSDTFDRVSAVGGSEEALIVVSLGSAVTVAATNTVFAGAGDGVSISNLPSDSTVTFDNDTLVGMGDGTALTATTTANVTINLDNSIAYRANDPGGTSVSLFALTSPVDFDSEYSDYPTPENGQSGNQNDATLDEEHVVRTAPKFVSDPSTPATGNYEEASGSPTIDGGSSAYEPTDHLDLAGEPRVLGAGIDIGAYEFVASPAITVGTPSAVKQTSLTFNGTAGTADATGSSVFQYGLTASYGNSTTAVPLTSTSSPQNVSGPATGLVAGDTYHYELCVTLVTSSCSPDQTVTTLPDLPVIADERSSAVTATGATVSASVNPGNGSTSVHFELGPTKSYGVSTPVQTLSAGTAAQNVTAALKLKAGSVYHVRAVATNGGGTTDGPDFTIVTPNPGGTPAIVSPSFSPPKFTARAGSHLKLTLSIAARVTVTLALNGHKAHDKCLASAKHGKRCAVKAGKRTFIGSSGTNSFRFSAKGLKPGSYTATLTATDLAGKRSLARTIKFTIKS